MKNAVRAPLSSFAPPNTETPRLSALRAVFGDFEVETASFKNPASAATRSAARTGLAGSSRGSWSLRRSRSVLPRLLGSSLVLAGLAAALADTACTSSCLRNTDCGSGETCVSGTCIVVVVADGATVDAMTARPSSTPTPTAISSTTAPAPTGTAPPPDAEAPPVDAWTATPEAGYTVPDGF